MCSLLTGINWEQDHLNISSLQTAVGIAYELLLSQKYFLWN